MAEDGGFEKLAVGVAHALDVVVLVGPALLPQVQVEDLAVVGDAGEGGAEVGVEVVVGGWGVDLWGVSCWKWGEVDLVGSGGGLLTDLGFEVLNAGREVAVMGDDAVDFEIPLGFDLRLAGLAVEGFLAFFDVLDECEAVGEVGVGDRGPCEGGCGHDAACERKMDVGG